MRRARKRAWRVEKQKARNRSGLRASRSSANVLHLLHDHLARHVGMVRAEIVQGLGLVELPREVLPGIEVLGAGRLVLERDGVRQAIVVAPANAAAQFDSSLLRAER